MTQPKFISVIEGPLKGSILQVADETENDFVVASGGGVIYISKSDAVYIGGHYSVEITRETENERGAAKVEITSTNPESDIIRKAIEYHEQKENELEAENERLKRRVDDLTTELNEAQKTILEMKKRIDVLTNERDEYKRLNEFHIEQVEIGNERREKMKHTVVSLHEQINKLTEERDQLIRELDKVRDELDRANRVIDRLTKSPTF